ncbi:MAG: winged helix-turn-helix transcriptional regulator [Thermoplasmata archaeon]|nr:MAG: winged helix-turn-helix transcriptional regulator [Thermoplasmata archaeon]
MIAEEDIPILEVLNLDKAKAIYLVILEKIGISQGDICKILGLNHQAVIWYAKKLENLDLISSLEDGKYRRYYPSALLMKKKDKYQKRIKNFKNNIIARFKGERLSPTILRSTEDKIVVRITRGTEKAVLTLHTNPFVTVLT